MSEQSLRAHIRAGRAPDRAFYEKAAAEFAKQHRADCHVYLRQSYAALSAGPDEDHPKLTADFVVEYKKG